MTNPTSCVRDTFERHKNAYVATSASLKGLFVSHKTLSRVYDTVPSAIRLLFKAKYGLDVSVEEADCRQHRHGISDVVFLVKSQKEIEE